MSEPSSSTSSSPPLCPGTSIELPASPKGVSCVPLQPRQQQALYQLQRKLAEVRWTTAVAITNPLDPNNPVVFATDRWRELSGLSLGVSPRSAQGAATDTSVVVSLSCMQQQKCPCRALLLSHRGGDTSVAPFWSMVSFSPIVDGESPLLWIELLEDYTEHMAQIIMQPKHQYCRRAPAHQPRRQLAGVRAQMLLKPAVYETDADRGHSRLSPPPPSPTSEHLGWAGAPSLVKMLGWHNLALAPEHLVDRVIDAVARVGGSHDVLECSNVSGDFYVVRATIATEITEIAGGAEKVVLHFFIGSDDDEATYRISCSRVAGDTLRFHNVYRAIQAMIGFQGASPKSASQIAAQPPAMGHRQTMLAPEAHPTGFMMEVN